MPIRVIRVLEYEYPTQEACELDVSSWFVPPNGVRRLTTTGKMIRSATTFPFTTDQPTILDPPTQQDGLLRWSDVKPVLDTPVTKRDKVVYSLWAGIDLSRPKTLLEVCQMQADYLLRTSLIIGQGGIENDDAHRG